jgi:hypothetical protein
MTPHTSSASAFTDEQGDGTLSSCNFEVDLVSPTEIFNIHLGERRQIALAGPFVAHGFVSTTPM